MVTKVDFASLSEPQLTLTIPDHLCKDFLGIMALDILHDAKGHGYLAGHPLARVTDLIAQAIILHNQENIVTCTEICGVVSPQTTQPLAVLPANSSLQFLSEVARGCGELRSPQIQNYVFKQVLTYFLELWSDNIQALGLTELPGTTCDIEHLRGIVTLPLRNVADRDDEDAFISLGKNKQGIEVQNYLDQRDKLSSQCAETMSFVSPKGVHKPADYFRQASGIVDIIKTRTADKSKVVLDMKSAAGLIRTLTDPLGYTTGLPTYADPGYNMPGMSAIRQHAEIAFIDHNQRPHENTYTGPQEFRYCIQLLTPLHSEPLIILDVTYFYGVAKDGLDRKNMLVSVLEETFMGTLPRSITMAASLNEYLRPGPKQVAVTIQETLSIVQHLIWDHYHEMCPQSPLLSSLKPVYSCLNSGNHLELALFQGVVSHSCLPPNIAASLYQWCTAENVIFRTSYILCTLTNLYHFNVHDNLPQNESFSIFPLQMITTILPKLMYDYLTEGGDLNLLAFSYHQLKLLKQFIAQAGNRQTLEKLLDNQWLPKRKGKLVTQITKQVLDWRKAQASNLAASQDYIIQYIQRLLVTCRQNLGVLVELDECSADDPRIEEELQRLPLFQPDGLLEHTLLSHLHFYQPEMWVRTQSTIRTGLLLSTLMDTILWKKPLYQPGIDLQVSLIEVVNSSREDTMYDALRSVIGKFSGDFGQIMWCICYGHIFASEDNNTSAMALFLHRLPKKYINANVTTSGTNVWGNIHGLGDGSAVDVSLNK